MEAFSDGVLALAPTMLAYLISFLFIATYWVNHHLIFQAAERINVKILRCGIA